MKNIMMLLISFFVTISIQAIMIVRHRGAAGYMPENTLSSFERAITDGVDMIEFDIWKCLPGELIVFHDSKLDRITNVTGRVDSKNLEELKNLVVLGKKTIFTLSEVLDCINRRARIYIELKGSHVALEVVEIIEDYVQNKKWDYQDFVVASFDYIQLCEVKNRNKDIFIAALIYEIPINLSECAVQMNADITVLDAE